MLNHKAIARIYESAEFWGAPMWMADKYVEEHIEQFKIKPKEYIIKIILVTKQRGKEE